MIAQKAIFATLVVFGLLVLLAAAVLPNRTASPRLLIRIRSAPPLHLFTNATPEVVGKFMPNSYQVLPLDLGSETNITAADVEQLKNLVAGKSPFSAKCSSIEFVDHKEAIVTAKGLFGGEDHSLFEKSDSAWKLIHKRSGRE